MRMSTVVLLILCGFFAGSPLMAEDVVPPPLQLAPGSGMQKGQNVPPPVTVQDQKLRDIHGPLQLPEAADYTLPLVAGLLFVLLLVAVIWFFYFRKKAVRLPGADEVALAALMRARGLISSNQSLQYSVKLSDILRRYIEDRFRIRSTRQTTKEFFAGLTEHPQQASMLPEDHRERLKECLEECDMAKFARYAPDQNSMEKMESAVQYFVESTTEKKGGDK